MKIKIIAASFITLSFMLPLQASAASISGLYVFGDSLSDTGNTFNLTGGAFDPEKAIPSSLLYSQGRFSNGSVWVDYVGEKLGLKPTPITSLLPNLDVTQPIATTFPTQGINFSIGGASSGEGNAIVSLPLPGVLQQVFAFQGLLQVNQQTLDPNALYAVWGGANDYLFPQLLDPNKPQPYENISQAVGTLAAIGAKNIVVFNLPDLGKLPAAKLDGRNPAALTLASQDFNSKLAQNLAGIRQNQKANIIEIDIYSLFRRAEKNPSEFGFDNFTDSCLAQFPVCSNDPSKYFFWDNLHPTTAGQKIVAESVLAATTPESPATIGVLALGALGVISRLKSLKKKSGFMPMSQVSSK